jgi:hypothetical protein
MKLAAVNPQLGLNIEGLMSKDVCSRLRLTSEFFLVSFPVVPFCRFTSLKRARSLKKFKECLNQAIVE